MTAEDRPSALATATTGAPAAGADTAEPSDLASVVETAAASVVAIDVATQDPTRGGPGTDEAAGSGFVYDAYGLIATNAHVIEGATSITVTLPDGTTTTATVVGSDPAADLALLRIGRNDLPPLALGTSATLRVGQVVFAVGNALALSGAPTATRGIVSALDRTVTTDDGTTYHHLVQTDAAINPGNSGGPLVDAAGRVVGIDTVAYEGAENVGFAIAIDEAAPVLAALATR